VSPAGGVQINFGRIEQRIVQRAMSGGQVGAEYALSRAIHHAPVRKLFRGTTYSTSRAGFRQPRLRRANAGSVQRIGHANSAEPLFRTRNAQGKTEFLSGDFRRVRNGKLVKIRTSTDIPASQRRGYRAQVQGGTILFARGRGGKLTARAIAPISASQVRPSGRPVVKPTGRFEIEGSTRAHFTTGGNLVGGKSLPSGRLVGQTRRGSTTRVGGRLRGELHVQGPVRQDATFWWYVVSATKDTETGRLYPLDQEYGTRHHPPHPFLRPALAESRDKFRNAVKRTLRGVND
jgi:hypothetical protein